MIRPQFSLAALFVVVTMVGIFVGVVKWSLDAGLSPAAVALTFLVIVGCASVGIAKSLTL